MIQAILIAVISAFAFGATSGGWMVHRWYKVDALHAQVKFLKEDRARYKKALQLGEEIDDEDVKVETSNDEIQRAILARAAEINVANTPVDHVCFDTGWLLSIGNLK